MSHMTVSSAQPQGQNIAASQTSMQGIFGGMPFSGSFLDMIMAAFSAPAGTTGQTMPTLMSKGQTDPLSDENLPETDDQNAGINLLHPDLLMLLQNQMATYSNQENGQTAGLHGSSGGQNGNPLSLLSDMAQNDNGQPTQDILKEIMTVLKMKQDEMSGSPVVITNAINKDANTSINTSTPDQNVYSQILSSLPQDDTEMTDDELNDIAKSLNSISPEGEEIPQMSSQKSHLNPATKMDTSGYTAPHLDADATGYTANMTSDAQDPRMGTQKQEGSSNPHVMRDINTAALDPLNLSDTSFIDQSVRSYPHIQIQTTSSSVSGSMTAHAATSPSHIVAMNLIGMTGQKEAQSLSFQMTPAELGKIQIKMTYGKDKSLKADIFVEKQDTLNMLQKDSQSLEDIMKNAGISTDAGSLNFSLASQNQFSDFVGQDNGSGYPASTSNNLDGVDMDLITQSNETWFTDSTTGHVHYNIYA